MLINALANASATVSTNLIMYTLHFLHVQGKRYIPRLSPHIPAATKYGQWTLNNKVSWTAESFFPASNQAARKMDMKNHFAANFN